MKLFNPVLCGFHPDPAIVCANGEYYIANSTFEWYPGVEIHRSKDLKTWLHVPSPLSEKRLLDMTGNEASCGIWAPCLSYADGLFYLVYTNVRSWNDGPWKDTPNFLTTATAIEGPWSDPVFMNASGFDPSLFHDDDGRKWFINMEWDYRKTGSSQFSGLVIQEYRPDQKKLVGSVHKIPSRSDIGCIEGPHIYKRNDWYYIAAAEGGTGYEHALTCMRSRSLFGPYELHPANPLVSSYGYPELRLQKAGHGSWCHSPDGKRTYLAYLCGRPLPGTDRCVLGRETAIAELIWQNDWPWLKQPDGTLKNTPPEYVELPGDSDVTPGNAVRSSKTYRFTDNRFLDDFKTLRVPLTAQRYSLSAHPGFLRIQGGQSPLSRFEQSVLARRQKDFSFEAETKVYFEPDSFQQLAGLTYRYDEDTQYLCTVTYDETARTKILRVLTIMPGIFDQGIAIALDAGKPVWIKLSVSGIIGQFSWSRNGTQWQKMRPLIDASKLSDEYGGMGFTGAFVGMFCVDTSCYSKYADFEYFSYGKTDS